MLFYKDEDALYYRVEKVRDIDITSTKCITGTNGEKTWIPTKFEYVQPTTEIFVETTGVFKSYTEICDYYKKKLIFENI